MRMAWGKTLSCLVKSKESPRYDGKDNDEDPADDELRRMQSHACVGGTGLLDLRLLHRSTS